MKFKLVIDQDKEEEVVATVHERSELTDRIEELLMGCGGPDRLPVYTEDDMKMLPFSRMECVSVQDGKTYVIDDRGKQYRLRMRLYEVEELLPAYFIRINKSALANEHRLERFRASYSGAVDAVFKSGYTEYVSRRCFAQIKRRFEVK